MYIQNIEKILNCTQMFIQYYEIMYIEYLFTKDNQYAGLPVTLFSILLENVPFYYNYVAIASSLHLVVLKLLNGFTITFTKILSNYCYQLLLSFFVLLVPLK